jgi:hypothetical protein
MILFDSDNARNAALKTTLFFTKIFIEIRLK